LGALSITGNEFYRRAAGVPLPNATSMPYEGYLGDDVDTIDHLDRELSDPSSGVELPAAVILEVVQGEGGLNAVSIAWLRRLEALCNEKGIVLIIDDIQAGCGRTGSFFSFESAGINPDIVTLSKSLSGYGLPCAVVLLKRALDLWEPGQHNGTFRGNNHAFITATAMLNHYWRTPEFAETVVEKGIHLGNRLQKLVDCFSPHLLGVRGRGMMIGVACADPKRAAAITSKAFEHGLVIERSGAEDEVIKCMTPLTTSYPELDEGVDILARVIAEELGVRTLRSRKAIRTHSEHDFELQV
ncbi:MAG: aminotransferase class III-fold pyridoxal phosphate-dependent enzyme, partial [Hyphomicrobium sp.]